MVVSNAEGQVFCARVWVCNVVTKPYKYLLRTDVMGVHW